MHALLKDGMQVSCGFQKVLLPLRSAALIADLWTNIALLHHYDFFDSKTVLPTYNQNFF